MRAIGKITVEDHLTPVVDAFNAVLPPQEHLFVLSDAVRVEHGVGRSGPYIRLLPTPSLMATMSLALQERARTFDDDKAVGRIG